MCARKKLEIESYERQESATVQAKKAVNLNAFFFFYSFSCHEQFRIQDSSGLALCKCSSFTKSLKSLFSSFPVEPKEKKTKTKTSMSARDRTRISSMTPPRNQATIVIHIYICIIQGESRD